MYNWPKHFPTQCPPSSAHEMSGLIYRFINNNTPKDKDFLSYYERDPEEHDNCKARGLSVLKTYADCLEMRKGIPALKKKKIATGTLPTGSGVINKTPSFNCVNHHTWWRFLPVSTVAPLFSTLTEPVEK